MPLWNTSNLFSKSSEIDNEIDNFLKSNKIEEAFKLAAQNEHNLHRHSLNIIGKKYLDYLLRHLEFIKAAKCSVMFCRDEQLWLEVISDFLNVSKIKVLAPYVPIGSIKGEIQLEKKIYNTILSELINDPNDNEAQNILLQIVSTLWPSDLYDIELLVSSIINTLLENSDNRTLYNVLAVLFCFQEKFDKALSIYFKLQSKSIFDVVRKYSLFDEVHDKTEQLMNLDFQKSIKLFIEHPEYFQTEIIVKQLQIPDREKYLFSYLDGLFNKVHTKCLTQKCLDYQNLLAHLYSKYAPDNLLSFLKSSDHYNMKDALNVCKENGFTREKVFVLARMGNTNLALEAIVQELRDIQQAVAFCKEYDDSDMWNSLITFCMAEPIFIKDLIENIGIDVKFVDPRNLIEQINKDYEIPHLRDAIVGLLQQYRAQINIQETCNRILVPDQYSVLLHRTKVSKKGIQIDYEDKCRVCGLSILKPPLLATGGPGKYYLPASVNNKCEKERCACTCPDQKSFYQGPVGCKGKHSENWKQKENNTVVFLCRHAYHSSCLDNENLVCIICEGSDSKTMLLTNKTQ